MNAFRYDGRLIHSSTPYLDMGNFFNPEDFLTDSDVHVFKLSDEEFRRRRSYLLESCETKYLSEQYIKVVEKRETFSLALPESVSFDALSRKDIFAIFFSKMHSRAFSRSFRLSKFFNELLSRNIAAFSIRIRGGQLQSGWHNEDPKDAYFGHMRFCYSDHVRIHDPTSILPFTFDMQHGCWTGNHLVEILNKMKHPFINLIVQLVKDENLNFKPWMINTAELVFARETKEQDWKLVERIKPRTVSFWRQIEDRPELWDAAERIQGITCNELGEIIQQWCSGIWTHKCKEFEGGHTVPADVKAILKHWQSWTVAKKKLTFVPSQNDSFLIICSRIVRGPPLEVQFEVFVNIRNLSDMIFLREFGLPRRSPLDYSSYAFDPDLPLVPEAFCSLLSTYLSTGRRQN